MPDERYDRDREERLAGWRSNIDQRVLTLEESMREMVSAAKHAEATAIRMEGTIAMVQREVTECRDDLRKAAERVDRGRDSAVEELKDTINSHEADGRAWRISKFQVFVGGAMAFVCSATAAVITAALAGAFK